LNDLKAGDMSILHGDTSVIHNYGDTSIMHNDDNTSIIQDDHFQSRNTSFIGGGKSPDVVVDQIGDDNSMMNQSYQQ
jgi:hypothetical protein